MSMVDGMGIAEGFAWLAEPEHRIEAGELVMVTSPNTDFWQRTHYGFRNDNGHCLLREVGEDFAMTVKTRYRAHAQYDQCGLMVRVDGENWIKASTEFETARHSRLGSVVTNHGYSDWATIDLEGEVTEMCYRIQSQGKLKDYLIEFSRDGRKWNQLRIAHLHAASAPVQIGIYACSPKDSRFEARFSEFEIRSSDWK